MSDKPRLWPTVAKEARDEAAVEAMRGVRALGPIVRNERPYTETDRLRGESIALASLQRIAWLMQFSGAPIRPMNE
jgi:hypothetical protein